MSKNYEEEYITNSKYIMQQLSTEKNRDDYISVIELEIQDQVEEQERKYPLKESF